MPHPPAPCSCPCPSEHHYKDAQSCRGASKQPVEELTPPACPSMGFLGTSPVREKPAKQEDLSKANTGFCPLLKNPLDPQVTFPLTQKGPTLLARVPREPQAGLEGNLGVLAPGAIPPPSVPIWAVQTVWSFPLPYINLGSPFSYCFFCIDF